MSVVKLTRELVDRHVAQLGDAELAAKIAAERAAIDAVVTTQHTTSPTRRLVSKTELAEMLDVCEPHVEGMQRDGRIPPEAIVRAGRRVRYDLERVIDALRGKGAAESRGAAWARRKNTLRVIEGGT